MKTLEYWYIYRFFSNFISVFTILIFHVRTLIYISTAPVYNLALAAAEKESNFLMHLIQIV